MEEVKVIKHQMFRDGGSIEYRDIHNRRYYVLAPFYKREGIFSTMPWQGIREDGYRDIMLKDIKLEIVDAL